ncbi:MAG: excinuclease ABC subunit C [Motiliproteus sp.]
MGQDRHSQADRQPVIFDTNINHVLVNGAGIALSKLKRAKSFNARLYYYAEIGVYLEVSLSRGAGISDESRDLLSNMHNEATHIHMQQNKNTKLKG